MVKRLFTFHRTSKLSTMQSTFVLLNSDAINLAGSSLSFTVQYRGLTLYMMQINTFFHRYAKIWPWKYPFHKAIT
jgi:hypothetical protein